MLKDRSGQLPYSTAVDFTDGDYARIFEAIIAPLDDLPERKVVEEIRTAEDDKPLPAAPGPDARGGPITPAPEPKVRPRKKVEKKDPEPTAGASPAPAQEPARTPRPRRRLRRPRPPSRTQPRRSPPRPLPPPSRRSPRSPTAASPARSYPPLGPPRTRPRRSPRRRRGEAASCGDDPPNRTAKYVGCGKDLAGEPTDLVGLAQIKYSTALCRECYQKAKTKTLP